VLQLIGAAMLSLRVLNEMWTNGIESRLVLTTRKMEWNDGRLVGWLELNGTFNTI